MSKEIHVVIIWLGLLAKRFCLLTFERHGSGRLLMLAKALNMLSSFHRSSQNRYMFVVHITIRWKLIAPSKNITFKYNE